MKVIIKELTSIQKRKILGNDKIKPLFENIMANKENHISDMSGIDVSINKNGSIHNDLFKHNQNEKNTDDFIC